MAAAPSVRDEVEVECHASIDKCHDVADWGFNGGEVVHLIFLVVGRFCWRCEFKVGGCEKDGPLEQAALSAVRELMMVERWNRVMGVLGVVVVENQSDGTRNA